MDPGTLKSSNHSRERLDLSPFQSCTVVRSSSTAFFVLKHDRRVYMGTALIQFFGIGYLIQMLLALGGDTQFSPCTSTVYLLFLSSHLYMDYVICFSRGLTSRITIVDVEEFCFARKLWPISTCTQAAKHDLDHCRIVQSTSRKIDR